jgi:hypothetical protein
LILVLVVIAEAALAQQSPTAANRAVRSGVTKSKDTVTIGEPFEIRVRIRAPADADIRFPDNPDTAGTVQARDPRRIVTTDSTQSLDQTAVYHVAAWDVGVQPVRFDDVIVSWTGPASLGERRVPLGGVSIFVRSVLPADSALRVPKPARPLWGTRPFPWWLIAALLAAIAAGLALWWWLRRRRRPPAPVIVDPYAHAIRQLNRIEAMGLVDAGERTRFVALVVEVVRDYLAARFVAASLALTSRELVATLRRERSVPLEQLARVLHEADLAKFAGWTLSEERARNLASEARKIIEREHRASHPPRAAGEAAA